jgi:membrane protease YdiL (CAAX protease family)
MGVAGIFLLLAAIAFYGGHFLLMVSGLPKITAGVFFESRMLFWIALGLLLLYSRRVEKANFLPWKEQMKRPLFYVGSIIISLIIIYVVSFVLKVIVHAFGHEGTSHKMLGYVALFKSSMPLLILTALTAGVTEELIFRGYIQPRLETASNSPALAVVITSLLFGVLHSPYGTITQVVVPIFIGAFFSLFYRRYRNIKICIVTHFLFDLFSLLAWTHLQTKG